MSPVRSLPVLAGLLCVGQLSVAHAFDFSLKLEPGVAIPLTQPQTDHFTVGGGFFGRAGWGVASMLDLQIAGAFFAFPNKDSGDPVMIGAVGVGPRLQLPHANRTVSPWVDADILYIRTGSFDRLGFDVGAGLGFRATRSGSLWVGLFARYLQIVQPQVDGFDNRDAKILLAGLYLEVHPIPPFIDSDRDGIRDSLDACPDRAGPAENKGCPWADTDGDGVLDKDDLCPALAGPRENKGCPWPDSDGDGLVDNEDKCPQLAGPVENGGCPWPDTDGDGVVDKDDKCPTKPGPAANGGCPWPDSDGDGVLDKDDQCPNTAGPADNNGCPRYAKVVVTDANIQILEKIFFAYDKSDIKPRSFPLLDEVVTALRDHDKLRLRIEGHTDSKGALAHNMALSEGRAMSVYKYLVEKGIDAKRLESAGYGPSQPLDSNVTEAGREKNRRVEFVIIP